MNIRDGYALHEHIKAMGVCPASNQHFFVCVNVLKDLGDAFTILHDNL